MHVGLSLEQSLSVWQPGTQALFVQICVRGQLLSLPLHPDEPLEPPLDELLDEPSNVHAASAPKQIVLSPLRVGARHASFSNVLLIVLQHAASVAHEFGAAPLELLVLGGGGVVGAGVGAGAGAGGGAVVVVLLGAGAECVTDFAGVVSGSELSSPLGSLVVATGAVAQAIVPTARTVARVPTNPRRAFVFIWSVLGDQYSKGLATRRDPQMLVFVEGDLGIVGSTSSLSGPPVPLVKPLLTARHL